MSSDIPRARRELAVVIADPNCPPAIRLRIKDYALPFMTRAAPVKRARTTAKPIGPKLKSQIKAYAATHSKMANRDIGAVFGVDGGRVSEILTGKR